jgi:cell division transport system permease protein
MSGSYDNRNGPPRRPPVAQAMYDDGEYMGDTGLYTEPQTGAAQRAPRESGPRPMMQGEPVAPQTQRPTAPIQQPPSDLYAEARTTKQKRRMSGAAIVPPGSVTGRSLVLVISIMCFLACLTAGCVYMINKSADTWLRDMASEVTIQVEPNDKIDTDKVVKDVVALMTREVGITNVKAMSLDDSAGLLEPWLGQADALKSLPIPRLIALEIDPNSPPDLEALRQKLATKFKGVSLDDHRHWQQQIRTVTRSFALGGLVILLLVAAATTAIIVSATRSAMASNKDIVEVLHFVGATDRFIAREFDKHFLKLGISAGLVGASAACLVFLAAPPIIELIGGRTVTMTEVHRLIGSGSLELYGYLLMGGVVVVIAGLCMLTSRLGVFRILNNRS